MYLRYWKDEGKATVVECVDRLVFDSHSKLQYRTDHAGIFTWHNIRFGFDYLQFTMSKD